MHVLIARHSVAHPKEHLLEDAHRWLSGEGIVRARSLGLELLKRNIHFTHLLSSPYVRAIQTATILNEIVGSDVPVKVSPFLALDYGTTAEALAFLDELEDDAKVLLVSHDPKVYRLATTLLGDEFSLRFSEASLLSIEINETSSKIDFWIDGHDL